jgi:hypothetical protein
MTKINYSPLFVAAVADLTTSSVLCMARSERNFAIVNVLRREGLQNAGVGDKALPALTMALSREPNLAALNLEVPVLAHAVRRSRKS